MSEGDKIFDPDLGSLIVIKCNGQDIPRGIYVEDYQETPQMGLGILINAIGLVLVPQ